MENQSTQTGQSIVRNVFHGFTTWVVPLILSFIATPVIVKSLGHNDYGIYSLVLGFIGYSFTFGIGRSLTKFIAEHRVKGETEKIRDIISATFFLNILVGLVSIFLICTLSGWLVRDIFRIEVAFQSKTIIAMYLASLIIFTTMVNQVFVAILQGIQRFDVFSKIYNGVSLLLLTGNILLAYWGYGILFLLGWNLAVIGLNCVIGILSTKRLLPEFRLHLNFRKDTLKIVIKYSSGVVFYQIIGNFWLLFERGWITANLGTESLTYYVVPMTLGLYIHGFISSLTLVIFPLASESRDDVDKLLNIYTKATKIVSALVVFAAVTLIIESKLFLSLWISPEFADQTALILVIHAISFSILSLQIITWQLSEGLSSPKYNIFTSILSLLVGIPLMILLTDSYGIAGIALARLSAILINFFIIFYAEKIFLGRTLWKLWSKILLILFFAMILTGFVEKTILRLMPVSWFTFLAVGMVGAMIYLGTLWAFRYFTKDEVKWFRKVIRN